MHASLPVHPLTGTRALGWRKARPGEDEGELHPIWPILGGAPDEGDEEQDQDDDAKDGDEGQGDGTGDEGNGDQDDADPDGTDQLGDAGKRALDSMKGKWKTERDKRRALEQQLAARDKPAGDQPDVDTVRAEAAREATAKANARILRSEVRAAAAGKLADPRDALRFLDLDQFEVDESGDVDAEEIAEAIEDLIKTKPYLAAATAKRFQGTGDGGARKGKSRPAQLTREDLKRMSPEQIVKAKDEGRLDDALGISR
ncbi:hypothetical protein JBE04_08375 [Streptomyces sp. PRKS01-29]|nr:hypothetical protein [Streptomyces sabulosicollis]MBI0294497.1 hypothetical protein [Streptomyces sabulosicollis]